MNTSISRSISTTPPSHYIVKIQSFSSLATNIGNAYHSREFEAGGYKWKLSLHPKGNININVNDHISVYLTMVVDEISFRPGSEVNAILRFFLFDQKNDNYLVIEGPIRRFDWRKHEWGFDRLVSLKDFKNPSNGYLINDTCVFGAEVYIKQATGKIECLSMVESPISCKYTWKIDNLYKLNASYLESTTFIVGDQKWKIRMYPKGDTQGLGTHISLYLTLADRIRYPPDTRVYAEFVLRIVDQNFIVNSFSMPSEKDWFSARSHSWGWCKFISLNDFHSPKKGYMKNKSCIVEAEVTVYGVEKAL